MTKINQSAVTIMKTKSNNISISSMAAKSNQHQKATAAAVNIEIRNEMPTFATPKCPSPYVLPASVLLPASPTYLCLLLPIRLLVPACYLHYIPRAAILTL